MSPDGDRKGTDVPDLGLLLDVDGPIASPVTRSIAIPSIAQDLVRLARGGVPIAFITGRSDAFIRDRVVTALLGAGLADVDEAFRIFGVFEKGAAWAPITREGMGEVSVEDSVALPPAVVQEVRELVTTEFAHAMFFDETKRAMISVEQRTDVSSEVYYPEQERFETLVFDLAVRHGLGMRHGTRVAEDSAGNVPFRIDTTVISTDVESVTLDKDHAAERALAYFAESGDLPRRWRTAGDSRSDYKMADHLHSAGYDVAHVDVRPSDGILDRDYPILTIDDLIHDEAGAKFLRGCVQELGLED